MAEVPDYLEPLTGWRWFAVRDRGRLLVSVVYPIPWLTADPGAAVCLCRGPGVPYTHPEDEAAPSFGCLCGYYAYRERAHVERHHQGDVLARVRLWGRVVVHERGYRAERIKIEQLLVPVGYPAGDALAVRYGVPVTEEGGAWTSESLYTWSSWSRSASRRTATHPTPRMIPGSKGLAAGILSRSRSRRDLVLAALAALPEPVTEAGSRPRPRSRSARPGLPTPAPKPGRDYGAAMLKAHRAEIVALMQADATLTVRQALARILGPR